jgi:RhoGAP domain/WW domain
LLPPPVPSPSKEREREREMSTPVLVRAVKALKPKKPGDIAFKKGAILRLAERDVDARRFRGQVLSARDGDEAGDASEGWFPFEVVRLLSDKETQEALAQIEKEKEREREAAQKQKAAASPDPVSKAGAISKQGSSSDLKKKSGGGLFGKKKKDDSGSAGLLPAASVFGGTLGRSMFCSYTEFRVPPMFQRCVDQIRATGLHETGIFRLAGASTDIDEIKQFWELNTDNDDIVATFDLSKYEIHAVSGVLKLFLRELSEPLFAFEQYEGFVAAVSNTNDVPGTVQKLTAVLLQLPEINYALTQVLFGLLVDIEQFSDENKMTAPNLGIVFGPTLMRTQTDDPVAAMMDNQHLVAVVAAMISNWAELDAAVLAAFATPVLAAPTIDVNSIKNVDANGIPLPEGWEMALDGTGRHFYIDHVNQTTSYQSPVAAAAVSAVSALAPVAVGPPPAVAPAPKVALPKPAPKPAPKPGRPKLAPKQQPGGPKVGPKIAPKIAPRVAPKVMPRSAPKPAAQQQPAAVVSSQQDTASSSSSGFDVASIVTNDVDGRPLPEGWERAHDANGRPFYINHHEQTTTFQSPLT